jgi:aspartate-semialdehyde dehydrogenase
VGQQFIARLAGHPWFNLAAVGASERSEGKSYAEAAPWRLASPMPAAVGSMIVEGCVPGRGPKVVFSALDAKAADVLEHEYAAAGHVVLSNARTHRMDPLVPLLIPEVNAAHLGLVVEQRRTKGWSGAIVTNPN